MTCATLKRHVGVLYTDGARSTHRFVLEQRRFWLETECITYDNSVAQRKVKYKKKLVVCRYEAQTLKNSCIASRLPSHQFLERADEVL